MKLFIILGIKHFLTVYSKTRLRTYGYHILCNVFSGCFCSGVIESVGCFWVTYQATRTGGRRSVWVAGSSLAWALAHFHGSFSSYLHAYFGSYRCSDDSLSGFSKLS